MFRRLCAAVAAADMVRTYKTVYITVPTYMHLCIYISTYQPTVRYVQSDDDNTASAGLMYI